MTFICPRCRREKDFGATYIPPLGRSYRCPCGLSTVVRPTWGADGTKTLVSSSSAQKPKPPEPKPPEPKPEPPAAVAVSVDRVKERLAEEAAQAAREATTTRGAAAVARPAPPPPPAPAPSSAGPIPEAPDERPSALKSRPLGFVEVGPEPSDEPVIRPPIAAPTESPVLSSRGAMPLDPGDATPTNRWTAEERTEAQAETTFEPLAPVLEPRRKQEPEPLPEPEPEAEAEPETETTNGFGELGVVERNTIPAPAPRPPPPLPAPEEAPVVVHSRDALEPDAADATLVVRRPEPPPPATGEPEDDEVEPPGDAPAEDAAAPPPRKRSLLRTTASWTLRAGLALTAFALGFGYIQYSAIRSELPTLDKIKNYRPPIVSEVRAADGTTLGKFFEEERYVVDLETVPEHVRKAFLASEDAGFYQHAGIDFKSIARAVVKNLAAGKKAQGGSTISQQVARTFFLSPKKTIKRKVAEILLAREIEKELTKDEILHRYLNQIFFGKGAYGIEAAARVHFGKHVQDLTLAEGALLAGLPQAPSRYAPQSNPEEALRRRAYVLREMFNNGWITEAERAAATDEELKLGTMADPTKTLTPFITEQIRRDLVKLLGHETVYRDGVIVTATVDLKMQAAAEAAVRAGRLRVDRRIGYQGAKENVDLKTVPIDEAVKALGETAPAAPGDAAKGIVEEVGLDRAYVRLPGGARGVVHRLDHLWAYPIVPEAYFKPRKADDLRRVLKPGDVIPVTVIDPAESAGLQAARKPARRGAKPDAKLLKKLEGRLTLALAQEPEIEGALLSYRIPDGRVLAMVGGSDYAKSEYLIPMQAHRQVGSTFKTIVYAAALAKKPPPGTPKAKRKDLRFTLATILQDKPIVMKAHEAELKTLRKRRATDEGEEQWKPGNSGDKYYGDTLLRSAYILSRNVPTIDLAQRVGLREIISIARKLGIQSPLEPDLSIVLGSGALTLDEIARAHAVFPAGGVRVEPRFVEQVVDRDGNVLFDLKAELEATPPAKVFDAKVAWVMTQLMVDVARSGTSLEATKQLKRPSGGKTGTTNDYVDAWYIGFTPDILTGVWVGYDKVRSLGVGQTGSEAALPIWIDYMKAATEGTPVQKFKAPEGVVKLKVDRKTGKLARKDQKPEEMVETWFVRGTEPSELSSSGKINEEPNIFEIDPGMR